MSVPTFRFEIKGAPPPNLPPNPRWLRSVAEYTRVLGRAHREGWQAELVEAHATPCDADVARCLLTRIPEIPRTLNLRFRGRRGRAGYRRGQYRISLPIESGATYGKLRVGVVIHEAAHVVARVRHGMRMKHGPEFCAVLRELLYATDWRKVMAEHATKTLAQHWREIAGRHRGPYLFSVTRPGKKPGFRTSQWLPGRMDKDDVYEEAMALLRDPRDEILGVSVWSDREDQFVMSFPRHQAEREPADAVLQAAERPAAADFQLAVETDGPVQQAAEPKAKPARPPKPEKKPGDRFPAFRGRALELDPGNAERWPKSKGAQMVRDFFERDGRRATAAEISQALATDLKLVGVEFPGSLVSRLKQAGFLREVSA